MQNGICQLSIIPLRSSASSQSEQVTQLLFGETYKVLEQSEQWVKICTHSDNYEGWISSNQFSVWDEKDDQPQLLTIFPYALAVNQLTNLSYYLLPGSLLHNLEWKENGEAEFSINHYRFLINLNVQQVSMVQTDKIGSFASLFLNTPYLWGGRTMWGIDCSGFTQLVYQMVGIQLPRDAWQQAEVGETVAFVNETQMGDLVFFDNEEGRITHVGMVLEAGEIIHASGKVRRDVLDSYGIFNEKQGKHTHKLRVIKRILR